MCESDPEHGGRRPSRASQGDLADALAGIPDRFPEPHVARGEKAYLGHIVGLPICRAVNEEPLAKLSAPMPRARVVASSTVRQVPEIDHQMNPPLVSVMMPVYNAERYVGKAVESILNQTFDDFEFLIVNDGSTDGSLEILREYAARDRRIRLSSRGNIGLAGSRDELLRAARGELGACMDADDISSPDRLEKQVAYLREHPECALVGSRVTIIDPDGQPLQVMGEHLEHEVLDRSLMNAEGQSIYNPTVMFRRHLALQVGGYRQEYDYMEDLDLFLRMAEVGRLANLPDPLLQYREHLSKVGHARVHEQSIGLRDTLREAYRRRGLAVPEWIAGFELAHPRAVDRYRTWAWWALGSGYIATARKHAWASLTHAPLSVDSWRLLYCAIRGN